MEHAGAPSASPARPHMERRRLAGVPVTLSWPSTEDGAKGQPKGAAFLLGGAMINMAEYDGLRDAIVGQNYLVVALYINVLWPPCNNHRKHAADVKNAFSALRTVHPELPASYHIVGHSAGGKIALLLASIIDPGRVAGVVALDPVDVTPVEFTHARGHNLPLDDGADGDAIVCSGDANDAGFVHVQRRERGGGAALAEEKKGRRIPITLTCTDGGRGIPKAHNAAAIHTLHPATMFHRHAHAGHMAYCDHGGGWAAGMLMPDVGTKEGNARAREAAHDLIREMLR